MSRKTERTQAFVLKATDYRDADRIITLLTRRFGRLSAIARSARRSRKRFGGRLEACMQLDVGLQFGRGDLATLTDANVLDAHLGILESLPRMRAAGAGLEPVRLVAPERAEDERLFDTLADYLAWVEKLAGEDASSATLSFSARALALAGLTPGLDACGVTGRRCPEGQAALFDPVRGTIVSREAGGGPLLLSAPTRSALTVSLSGAWREARFDAPARKQAADALWSFVTAHVGKELSSAWRSVAAD